jgi:hypothetical protein
MAWQRERAKARQVAGAAKGHKVMGHAGSMLVPNSEQAEAGMARDLAG